MLNGQTLGGTAFANEDIIQYNGTTWSYYFDGSDVGLSTARLDGFQVLADGSILLSFANRHDGLSIGRVEDSDIIRFTPTSIGSTTAGTFQFFFHGPANGFTAGNEDIDAFFYTESSQTLYVSMTSTWTVGAVSGTDRDILACAAFVANGPCAAPSIFFDGDDIGLTGSSEDIDTFFIGADGTIYFSTTGSFVLTNGLTGLGNDVLACAAPVTGVTTGCGTLTRQFVGNSSGITGNGLTGFGLVP